jgi:hypothetical protein
VEVFERARVHHRSAVDAYDRHVLEHGCETRVKAAEQP